MVILSFGSRLYGRQDASIQLQEAYQRVCIGTAIIERDLDITNVDSSQQRHHHQRRRRCCEMVLISGEAGSGKTALARSLQSSVKQNGGFFGCGKFDISSLDGNIATTTADIPLIMALTEWIHQIMIRKQREKSPTNGSNTKVDAVREVVLQQLSDESRAFLCRIIRGLEAFLSNQSTGTLDEGDCNRSDNSETMSSNINALMNKDSHEASKVIISKFILAISNAVNVPLVLLLDDLQWSDDLTVAVLQQILTGDLEDDDQNRNAGNLLLMGTVRTDEMSLSHSWSRMIDFLEQERHSLVTSIVVSNLTEEEIREMISDVLQCSPQTSQRVGNLIYQQTKGNVLFVRQALQSLIDDNNKVPLLLFHPDQNCWEWIEQHHDEDVDRTWKESNDFLIIMAHRMMQHDESVRYRLQVASCLGNRFPGDVWQAVAEMDAVSKSEIVANQQRDDDDVLVKMGYLTFRMDTDGPMLQWQHDRLWQAAHSLISNDERPSWHVMIGRRLLHGLSEIRIDETMFLVLSQFGLGRTLLTDLQERTQIAKLCLRAGEKAALSSSFRTASACLQLGVDLLGNNDEDGWQQDYNLSLALHSAAAEAYFCIAEFEQMDLHFASVLRHAKSYKDSLRARTMQMYSLGSRGWCEESCRQGIEVLGNLGVRFPKRGYNIAREWDFWKTHRMLNHKKDRTLLSLPVMRDEMKLATMSVLFVFIATCTVCQPHLLPFITTRMMRLTLKYGLCPASSQAFLSYAVYLLKIGQRKEAFRFEQLGLEIVQSLNAKEYLPRCYMIFYFFINPWNLPLRESIKPLEYAAQIALETGDIDIAARGLLGLCRVLTWAGKPLSEVRTASKKSCDFVKRYKQDGMIYVHNILLQFLDNLTARTNNDPLVLTGNFVNQEEAYRVARQLKNQFMLIDLPMSRLWLAFYLNDYELAWTMAAESRVAIDDSNVATFAVCQHRFLEAMTAVALSHQSDHKQCIATARKNLKDLKMMDNDAPENCNNKVLLLEAELAAIDGNMDVALAKFVRSMDRAGAEGLLHEQALASERAGIALRRCSDFSGAKHHLMKAKEHYQQWGATVKVRQLTQIYGL